MVGEIRILLTGEHHGVASLLDINVTVNRSSFSIEGPKRALSLRPVLTNSPSPSLGYDTLLKYPARASSASNSSAMMFGTTLFFPSVPALFLRTRYCISHPQHAPGP